MRGAWIEEFGYWAVLLGAIVEGETVLVAAGYAISAEYLQPMPTLLAAVAGGTLGDLAYYWLGRLYGARLLASRPALRRLRFRASRLARRWGRPTAALMRFAYGLRIVLPMTLGVARFPLLHLLPLNLLGSVVFSGTYLTLGYLFGESIEEAFGRLASARGSVLLVLVLLGGASWALREWWLVRATCADSASGSDLDPPAGPSPPSDGTTRVGS